MDVRDERLDPVRSFTVNSFRLDPERWREFVSDEKNQVKFNSFFNTQDYVNLFIWHDPEAGLSAGLDFPENLRAKVICVSKTGSELLTQESPKNMLIHDVHGEDVTSFIIVAFEEVRHRHHLLLWLTLMLT